MRRSPDRPGASALAIALLILAPRPGDDPGRRAIDDLLRQHRWAEAIARLDDRIDARPAVVDLVSRGNARAERGDLAGAQADFARAEALDPTAPEPLYRLALARLAAGDLDGYRRACARLLDRFGSTTDPAVASPIAYTCTAAPRSVADPTALVRLGEVAEPLFPGNARVRGATLYRAGRFAEAADILESAVLETTPVAWDWLFLAMAHRRAGQPALADADLDRAARWIAEAEAGVGRADGPRRSWHSWNERAEVLGLYREAQAVRAEEEGDLPADVFARSANR